MEHIIRNKYRSIFEEKLLDEIIEVSTIKDFKEGEKLMEIGEYIKKIPLLLEGAIKIIREDQREGEIVLYYIEEGDTCAMTLTCCLGETKSQVRSIAERDGSVVLVPVGKMDEWLVKYKSWRNFVLNSYNNRMNEMLTAIDSLAFMNMEERLCNLLRSKAKIYNSRFINNTHQELADELNTSRVVISRILKTLENEGIIQLNRKYIELLKP
ncbi:Crp/Fnr family transcriptional regulator [Myroides odoratimimus]|uniref:Crp/Fnr family transcriptional regulator n=1 Tax=Myroides odoratimimus TaxID=76832 RepID=UPI0010393B52|nr:Crp/Fnr family transcriptional regulator [Myroides odoratimimus]MCA4794271.1 Crp/Fnr family transcriptional regulator [Myroides odoratimimus]MCA4806057.1 Crp/Fnr family transcriptional regulator [Myroides odoratimimus]MCA4821531.1 Crp/Fnr family transcriptional regulator [Myroides odoratimimus]MCO7722147.1 Crp/Fnr family transcriptional regulator [Myroides odoratimimus]MDM1057698.1 Crp/Fnr family transcriptional regulator [Myroides odoratimimus]